MAQLSTKIKEYCKANNVINVDFTTDVKLQDDSNGQGAYIAEWNLDIAQPTDEQLNALESQANDVEALNQVYGNRKAEYPSIGDQLDMQYHDQIDGTATWKDAIAKVKADNKK